MAEPAGDPRLRRRPFVLVVDDDRDTRDLLRALLEAQGFTVIGEAADGEQAVATARALNPDVVLMDQRMPRLGGAAATRRIKAERPSVQVIILSLYEDVDALGAAEDAGAYCYLVKGCPTSLILDMVDPGHGRSRVAPQSPR
jgi:DNA-binding NarL/FixJ family response regulator